MASDFYFKIFSKRKEIGIYENQNLKNFLKIYFYKTDLKNLKISTQLKIFFFLINIGISYLFGMF